jgi:hypothetical protein
VILSRVEPFLLKLLIESALIQKKPCLGEEEHTINILKILFISNAGRELDADAFGCRASIRVIWFYVNLTAFSFAWS